jgi:uncharacterized membrane protein
MSARRLLRVAASLAIIVLVWTRMIRDWGAESGGWLAGSIVLSLILLLVVVVEVSGIQQKWRRQRDETPKKPLGLE